MLQVLIPREQAAGETRVAASPETVAKMVARGMEVTVEAGAGEASFFDDGAYRSAGATVHDDVKGAWRAADIVLKVAAPMEVDGDHEADRLKEGAVLVGFMAAYRNPDVVRRLVLRKVSSLAMELVPRITRAQKMDALSSQASIAGYKAVLLAAAALPKYFPLLMTAAGTVKPARVVVMGAGVAGLQAIATARRLGAVVEASDIRPAVKEQVESLGGKFIDLPEMTESGEGAGGYAREVTRDFLRKQQEIVHRHLVEANVVITTALVPGRRAPLLVPAVTVEQMAPGSVIVDLAVEQGGNCELSEAGKDVRRHGVLIIGHPNLPATLPADASLLYARNVLALVEHLVDKNGVLTVDPAEEVTGGTLLTHAGAIAHGPTRDALAALDADADATGEASNEGEGAS